ncbi:MAG: putative dsRNA-binding protein, partial [Gallionellaceae bacterium]|nr:putative dsRNA-binding protein [Gallionellaceae bacterium]
KSGGFRRPSILADAMEALFGAILLDGGYAATEKVILGMFVPYLDKVDVQTLGKDAKTLLQEYLQSKKISLPIYSIVSTGGQAHEQSFQVECSIPTLKITTHGEGSSRRNAEQQAAQAAYQQLYL